MVLLAKSVKFVSSQKANLAVSKTESPAGIAGKVVHGGQRGHCDVLSSHTCTPAKKLQPRSNIVVWRSSVNQLSQVYLRVTIERTLTMSVQAINTVYQAKAEWAMLCPMLASRLLLRTKLGIFKTYMVLTTPLRRTHYARRPTAWGSRYSRPWLWGLSSGPNGTLELTSSPATTRSSR